MIEEKIKLTADIHKLKKKGLGVKEINVMFRHPLELQQLFVMHEKSVTEIKESIGKNIRQWNAYYDKDYGLLRHSDIDKLSKCLGVEAKELFEMIERDIEIQKQK